MEVFPTVNYIVQVIILQLGLILFVLHCVCLILQLVRIFMYTSLLSRIFLLSVIVTRDTYINNLKQTSFINCEMKSMPLLVAILILCSNFFPILDPLIFE